MNIVLLGPPGSGKGSFSQRATSLYGVPHISLGDLLRNVVRKQTLLGRKIKSILASGSLVPDKLAAIVLRERLREGDAKGGFLLDGFPRTIKQAEMIDAFSHVDYAIHFFVSNKVLLQRLTGRIICQDCGAVYNENNAPPRRKELCDKCDGLLYTRDDDKPEAIENRIGVYRTLTEPLVDYFQKKEGVILVKIDAEKSIEEVFQSVMSRIPPRKRPPS